MYCYLIYNENYSLYDYFQKIQIPWTGCELINS